jgi:beta-lactamase class A
MTPGEAGMTPAWNEVSREILELASGVGVEVHLHARDVEGSGGVGIGEDTPVVTASVFKVPVAVALARLGQAGILDLAEEITIAPGTGPASPFGLATFRYPARLSLHDLGLLMIGVSDNVATDLVMQKVGQPAIDALIAELGLTVTAVPQTCQELLDTISDDLEVDYDDNERTLASYPMSRIRALSALQPEHTCRTTAEEMTRLLAMIWRDEAGAPEACADVRRWMGLQVWPHRLRSGFPDDDVAISGKTGTLPTVRNEVGVVEYGDGHRYAVAVFTVADDLRARVPKRDRFIGDAATLAVEFLRQAGAV